MLNWQENQMRTCFRGQHDVVGITGKCPTCADRHSHAVLEFMNDLAAEYIDNYYIPYEMGFDKLIDLAGIESN